VTVILDRHHVDTITPATRAWAAFAMIEEAPENWEQGHYRTPVSGGWVYDFAGWVLNLDGAHWVTRSRYLLSPASDDPNHHIRLVAPGVRVVHALDRIRRLLDLDDKGVWLLVDLEDTDLEKLRTHIVCVFGECDEQTGRTS